VVVVDEYDIVTETRMSGRDLVEGAVERSGYVNSRIRAESPVAYGVVI